MMSQFEIYNEPLHTLNTKQKVVINTINAHSYNIALKDKAFNIALKKGDVLIPDGIGIVLALRFFRGIYLPKIAGADLFFYEMNRLNQIHGKCFFLGSSEKILYRIQKHATVEFPNVEIGCYSPPYVKEFSADDNQKMIEAVNAFKPHVLFVGMTAPKQEKWVHHHKEQLNAGHICSIGAVFDFYAGTIRRAPRWMIKLGFEWFYRLYKEPRRMWRRYLIGNVLFLWNLMRYEVFDNKEVKEL